MSRKTLVFIISIIIGISAVVLVFWWIGFEKVLHTVKDFGWLGFGVFFGSMVLSHFFGTLGWLVIVKAHNMKIGLWDAFVAMLIDYPVGCLAPSMYIGGVPARSYFIHKRKGYPMSELIGTGLLSRFQELWGILLLIFLGSFVVISADLPFGLKIAIISVDTILAVLLFWSIRRFIKNIPIFCSWVDHFIKWNFFPKFFTNFRPKVERTEQLMVKSFRDKEHRKPMIAGFLLNLVCIFFIFIKPAIFFAFLYGWQDRMAEFYQTFTFSNLLLIFTLTQLIFMLQIIPGSLGPFDVLVPGIFLIIGIPGYEAGAYVLISRVGDIIIGIIGIAFIFNFGLERFLMGNANESCTANSSQCEEKTS